MVGFVAGTEAEVLQHRHCHREAVNELHGPADVSPVGVAANGALGMASPATGIQEAHLFADAVHQIFPGTLIPETGWVRPNDAPGWGIELDEDAVAEFAPVLSRHDAWALGAWALGARALGVRGPDGALHAP